MKRLVCFKLMILLLLIGTSCQKDNNQQSQLSGSTKSALGQTQPEFATVKIGSGSARYYFVGKINHPGMHIEIQGEVLINNFESGSSAIEEEEGGESSFLNSTDGKKFYLEGNITANNRVKLDVVPSDEYFNEKPKISATILGKLDCAKGMFQGKWSSNIDPKDTASLVLYFVARYNKIKDTKLRASISYPQFAAKEFASFNDTLAHIMYPKLDFCVAKVKNMLRQYSDTSIILPDGRKPTDALVAQHNVSVVYLASNLLALSYQLFFDENGAHPYGTTSSENWWRRSNGNFVTVRLPEIFIANSNYTKTLIDLLIVELNKNQKVREDHAQIQEQELLGMIRRESFAWFLHPAGVRIIFPTYSFGASHAAGEIEVNIPYSSLRSHLRFDGAAGEFLRQDGFVLNP